MFLAMRRPTAKRTVLVASTLIAGAGASSGPARPAPTSGSRAAVRADADALAADALTHDRYVRRTLYTWTTAAQVKEIRRAKRLLLREESPTRGASYIDQVLAAMTAVDPLAKLLFSTGYAKMRFAWHAPWATRLGWEGESYGRELVRVTLRSDAIVVALSTGRGFFDARDMENRRIPIDKAIATPRRIAAIYFVSEKGAGRYAMFPEPTETYRELVLCNEAMIESWAIGGEEIEREIEREATALEAFARHLRTRPALPADIAPPAAWRALAADAARPPERAYAAALAFANAKYRLDPDALEALAAVMRSTPKRPAVTGGGDVEFSVGTARGEPRVRPGKKPGTFGGTFATP